MCDLCNASGRRAGMCRWSVFALALALGSFLVFAQEGSDAPSRTTSAGPPARVARSDSAPAPAASAVPFLEPELVGVYHSDGKYKATSKRDRLSELERDEPRHQELARRTEVPGYVDLRPGGRVVEDYVPPAYARKTLKGKSLVSNVRDGIIAFVYGREPVLRAPTHLTTDSRQRLIVSDPVQRTVHVLDAKDPFWIAGGSQRRLQRPNGVAVDRADNIYVADGERGVILVYDADGRFLRYLGMFRGESLFSAPTGIAIDRKSGLLYVLDAPVGQLVVLDLAGNVVKRVGNSRDRKRRMTFDFPTEIAFADNRLAILDAGGSRVQILDTDGNLLKAFRIRNVIGATARAEMGLALDSAGNIYVSNLGTFNVRVYRQDGHCVGSFGRPGILGIWIDDADRVYLADTSNARVQVFQRAVVPKHH